jgi:tRNA-specific 2-thiouridylase
MPERVIVAMSGGVDSSVALLKILDAGYEAIGVTMKLWEYRDMGGSLIGESNCCPTEAINDAREICYAFGVPHHTLDFQAVFQATVVDNFVEEYLAGRTPNPCVRCNSYVKWNALLEYADQLNADFIATGHYARINIGPDGKHQVLQAADRLKDQSYVLWGIPRETLVRTLFPLGNLTKDQVRHEARKRCLTNANAPESQEICFIADNDYRRFLREAANGRTSEVSEGDIVDQEGNVLGKHAGHPFFTVGQRRGLGIAYKEPLYVKSINADTNQLTVAPHSSLFSSSCEIKSVNWLVDPPTAQLQVHARVRYNSQGALAQLNPKQSGARLEFEQPQLAITPGQSAVFYDGEVLLGGGVISKRDLE